MVQKPTRPDTDAIFDVTFNAICLRSRKLFQRYANSRLLMADAQCTISSTECLLLGFAYFKNAGQARKL